MALDHQDLIKAQTAGQQVVAQATGLGGLLLGRHGQVRKLLVGDGAAEDGDLRRAVIRAAIARQEDDADLTHRGLGKLNALAAVPLLEGALGRRLWLVVEVDGVVLEALFEQLPGAAEVDNLGDLDGRFPDQSELAGLSNVDALHAPDVSGVVLT